MSAYGRIVGWALMNELNAAPADVVFDFGGGRGGSDGAGAVFVWGMTTSRNPVSGFGFGSAIPVTPYSAHTVSMIGYLVVAAVGALFGFAFGAENARSREWWRRHSFRNR
jgi:hypothetical protein